MNQLNMLFGALFRPRSTFTRLGEGAKWVWLPALVVVMVAALGNVAVSVPLEMRAQMAWAEEQAAAEQGEASRGEMKVERGSGVKVEVDRGDEGGPVAEGDLVESSGPPEDAGSAIMMTGGLVFGAVGVLASLLVTATFFFVAGKVWAKRVVFGTCLSAVALAALPLAARDVLQAVFQSATGQWIQHQGISKLVAAKDVFEQGGIVYGILSQIDIWAIWALVLLFFGVRYAAGFEKKRAALALGIFTVLAVLIGASQAILIGIFAGA